MFRNKPTERNKEKQPVVKKRVPIKKNMNRESGIFTSDKATKSRHTDSTSASARETPRREKNPDKIYSAGDNGASMLATLQGNNVSLIVGCFPVAIDYIQFLFSLTRRILIQTVRYAIC